MDNPESASNPQTEKFFLWASFLLFVGVLSVALSTYSTEEDRVAALREDEARKEKAFVQIERQREQTSRYIERFTRDQEFVRDQARERLGVAESGEVVIRVDGAAALAQPAVANTPAKPARP